MDRKAGLMVAVALLLGTGLSPALPGLAGVAGAADEAQGAATFAGSSTESDEFFHVEWAVRPGRSGRSRIAGYVYNAYGRTARSVQLRISDVDAAGQTVASVIGPVLETVPGQSQVHFDVQAPGNSTSYRVAVASFSFDFADPGSK